ncbi:MAG: hypothetical protein AVDCRST_MAG59-3337, partial [uncultured Thermomicrobiales bacterium]
GTERSPGRSFDPALRPTRARGPGRGPRPEQPRRLGPQEGRL